MATSPVQFQFGGVVLSNVVGKYHPYPHLDPAGVNVIGVRHVLSVRGTLTGGLPPTLPGESTSDTLARLRYDLMRHRRYLVYAPFGTVVFEAGDRNNPTDPDANLDLANGPICKGFEVLLMSEGGIEVEVSVECTTPACTTDPARVVLAHTFRQTEDYDRRGYCTLTTTGTITVRSDLAGAVKVWDILNAAGVLGTRDGYQRVEPLQHGFVDEKNLTLAYVRTDKQYELRPPDQAPECDGELMIFNPGNGTAVQVAVSIRAKGAVGVTRSDLFKLVSLIALERITRLQFVDKDGKKSPILATRIKAPVLDNSVELQLSTLSSPSQINNTDGSFNTALLEPSAVGPGNRLPISILPLQPQIGGALAAPILRSAFQEPCAPLDAPLVANAPLPPVRSNNAPVPGVSGSLAGSVAASPAATGGVAGELSGGTTDGPAAGGGNPTAGQLTPQQIANILQGLIPVGPPGGGSSSSSAADTSFAAQVLASYNPSAGGAGSIDNSLGAFGSNPVAVAAAAAAADPEDSAVPYTVYLMRLAVRHATGWAALPSAGPKSSSGKRPPMTPVRVHQGKTEMDVVWSATRWGDPPQLLDPHPDDANYLLTRVEYTADECQRDADSGSMKYTRAGVYTYGVLDADAAKVFDLLPPHILAASRADNPLGLPQSTLAKGLAWAEAALAPPSPLFADVGRPAPPPPAPPQAPSPGELAGGLAVGPGGSPAGSGGLPGPITGVGGDPTTGYAPNPGG